MLRPKMMLLLATALAAPSALAQGENAGALTQAVAVAPAALEWTVTASMKTTLRTWAARQKWPAPQFLTDADWPVDVPGSVRGTIEEALKALVAGFDKAPVRPRIEITGNHVIVVSEAGAQ
jgi:hypothetical protein